MVDRKKILSRLTQLVKFMVQFKRSGYLPNLPEKLQNSLSKIINPDLQLETDEDWENAETVYQHIIDQFSQLKTIDDRHSALMYFSHEKYSDLFFDLLERKVDINFKDKNGYDALMYAASYGTPEQMALLISKDANVKAINTDGQTALMKAAQSGNLLKVTMLLSRGAAVDLRDNQGMSALMFAAKEDHLKVMLALMSKEANINAIDNSAKSVLIHAIENTVPWTAFDPILRTPEVCFFNNPPKKSKEVQDRPYQWHTIRLLVENGADLFYEKKLGSFAYAGVLKAAKQHSWTGIVCYFMLKNTKAEDLPKVQAAYRKTEPEHTRPSSAIDRQLIYDTLMNHVNAVKSLDEKIEILQDALKPDANALSRLMTGTLGGWTPLIRLKLAVYMDEQKPEESIRGRSLSKILKLIA